MYSRASSGRNGPKGRKKWEFLFKSRKKVGIFNSKVGII